MKKAGGRVSVSGSIRPWKASLTSLRSTQRKTRGFASRNKDKKRNSLWQIEGVPIHEPKEDMRLSRGRSSPDRADM